MRGRKPGSLRAFTCAECGTKQMVMGGSKPFYCDACRDTGSYLGTGRASAVGIVNRAIKRGELQPPREFACADCGITAEQYDHRDYNKPLEVVPVCRVCNLLRGPAIPRKGYFQSMFETRTWYYSSRKRAQMLFKVIGLDVDLSHLPGYLTFEHWLPFKDALLEWEGRE